MISSIVIIYSLFYCSCLPKIQELFLNILIVGLYLLLGHNEYILYLLLFASDQFSKPLNINSTLLSSKNYK